MRLPLRKLSNHRAHRRRDLSHTFSDVTVRRSSGSLISLVRVWRLIRAAKAAGRCFSHSDQAQVREAARAQNLTPPPNVSK